MSQGFTNDTTASPGTGTGLIVGQDDATINDPIINRIFDSNGNLIFRLNPIASAVNYWGTQNNTTGNAPILEALGTDTNVIGQIRGQGTGGVAIQGTGTNNNASAGFVGEFVSSSIPVASAVSLTTGTPANVTSISLTAGDWDVHGNVFISGAASNIARSQAWVSLTSATAPDLSLRSLDDTPSGSSLCGLVTPFFRVSISSTTTVYLSCQGNFSATATACGNIYARRVR